MEVRIKTKDNKMYRSTAYIEGAFAMKLFYPQRWNFVDNKWEETQESFIIVPYTNVLAISGRGKAKDFRR